MKLSRYIATLTAAFMALAVLAGCSSEFGEALTASAQNYNESQRERNRDRSESNDGERYEGSDSNRGWNNDNSRSNDGGRDNGHDPNGQMQPSSGYNNNVINILGESYIADGNRQTSQSGFWYNGTWYKRSDKKIQGRKFVEGDSSQGNGFWQASRYWVPAGGNGGGGGGGNDGNNGGYEKIINIQGETWVASGTRQSTQSGFWQNGQWYTRSNQWQSGTEYIQGNPNQSGGFWQYSKYWVRR